jgi:hypothetical protein
MQVRLLVLGVSVAVLGVSPLSAQSDAAPTSQGLPRRGEWMLSAGVDPLSGAGDYNRPGPAFQAGYERRLGASRFGLRVEGSYWRQTDRTTGGVPAGQRAEVLVRTRSIGGGSLLGTYQLREQTARVRPYLLGGVGVQYLTQDHALEWADPQAAGGLPVRTGPDGGRARRFSPSFSGGAGLAWRLGRASVFAEARATFLPRGIMAGQPSVQGVTFPLTLGLRF